MRPEPERILVVEPMSAGLTLLRAARELGIGTVVVSYDGDDRVVPAAARADVDIFLTADTNDEDELAKVVAELVTTTLLSGVTSGSEFYVGTATRIADRLGLPCLPVATVDAVRDKDLMRSAVKAAGLRVPEHRLVTSVAELDEAADAIGFPCILKPAAGSGSIQVSRADTREQLRVAFAALVTRPNYVFGQPEDGRAVVEEYVAGREVSVEGYVAGGRVRIVAITHKLLGPEPFFVEVGHIQPARVDASERAAIEEYVTAVAESLDVTMGPFHCEVRLTPHGPVLIELGARMPGDRIGELVRNTTGLSMPHLTVSAYVGRDISNFESGSPLAKSCGIHFFTAPHLDRYTSAHGLDTLAAQPWITELMTYIHPGEQIPPQRDLRCRIGHVIFTADSFAQAVERREWIAREVVFE